MNFLQLGVVTAVKELEYMRMIRQKYNPNFKWYELGELVLSCPKVNYKLNYKPGYFICPRTKKLIPTEECIEKIKIITQIPIEEKRTMPFI